MSPSGAIGLDYLRFATLVAGLRAGFCAAAGAAAGTAFAGLGAGSFTKELLLKPSTWSGGM
jgi:hypothetical protein